MRLVELLTIEDSFQIGRGVIVIPDFSLPNGWKNRTEVVVVRKPNGQQYEATAQFSMTHFNISDPDVSIDKRWRVVVQFPDGKKDELPTGTKILVSEQVKNAIIGDGRTS
jgi:hypothetical protein